MHTLFRLFFLAAALSIPFPSSAQPAIAPGAYVTEGGWGTLTIVKNKDGGLSFEISAIGSNAHTCGLSGEISSGRAVLEGEDDKPCIVTFEPAEDGVTVSDNDGACQIYCGARAGFTGRYLIPPAGCDAAAIQKSRNDFKRLYDKKAYAKALAKLEPVLDHCAPVILWADMGWIRNDLALTRYKMGDYTGCRSTLQPLEGDAGQTDEALRESYPPADAEVAIPIAHATRTNLKLCTKTEKKP
jgi:hypothetical protein